MIKKVKIQYLVIVGIVIVLLCMGIFIYKQTNVKEKAGISQKLNTPIIEVKNASDAMTLVDQKIIDKKPREGIVDGQGCLANKEILESNNVDEKAVTGQEPNTSIVESVLNANTTDLAEETIIDKKSEGDIMEDQRCSNTDSCSTKRYIDTLVTGPRGWFNLAMHDDVFYLKI